MSTQSPAATPKPKRIVVLSDGTGNSAAQVWRTNVWRLYQALDLANGRQVALYDDGVGSSSFKLWALLGGAIGLGLKRNILDLYTFVCRNYEDGDEIYAFGFSRGAFTIRMLVGLICREGLVPATTERELRRQAAAAYRQYRKRYTTTGRIERPLRAFRDAVIDVGNRLRRRSAYRDVPKRDVPRIRFLGVWDTVAAYGLPIEEMTRGASLWLWPMSLPDRELNAKVKRACHALALDDARTTFHPVLWSEQGETPADRVSDERLSQVWFTGMHTNVGGGYPDDALAHVSLGWMMDEARRCDLEFKTANPDVVAEAKASADEDGRLYNSRRGLAGYYRYGPRKVRDLTQDRSRAPKDHVTVDVPKIHESVFERIRSGARAYAPIGLPARYALVTAAGQILDLARNPHETGRQAATRADVQERVWNFVWRRRVTYFATVAASLFLATFPWWRPASEHAAESSRLSFLAPVIRAAGGMLPAFAHSWVEAFAASPGWFALGAAVVAALLSLGGRLETRIGDEMRAIWRAGATSGALPDDWIYRLRTHPLYRRFFRQLKWYILPTAFALLAVIAALVGGSRGLFAIGSAVGLVCRGSPAPVPVRDRVIEDGFETRVVCWPSGIALEAGTRYRITVEPTEPWRDASIPAPLAGIDHEATGFWMRAAVPLRRLLGEPWFKPVARIGSTGHDEHPLEPLRDAAGGVTSHLTAELTPRTSGELFLFVNDAVIGIPRLGTWFYRNNRGSARITVVPVPAP